MSTLTKKVSKTGTGASDAIDIAPDCKVDAIGMLLVPGGATASVQYSLDGTNWLDITGMSNKTASDDFTIVFPIYKVRAYVTTAVADPVILILRQNDGRDTNGS